MKTLASLITCLVLWSGFAIAEPVLNEDTVKGISAELTLAAKNADMATFEKYLYSGSKIIVDLDPSLSAGEMEIAYDEYMAMLEMALPMMQDAELYAEILSISVDDKNNQATIREKTIMTADMMGMKIQDVSISETTYGVVRGEIKVLVGKEQLISSGPVVQLEATLSIVDRREHKCSRHVIEYSPHDVTSARFINPFSARGFAGSDKDIVGDRRAGFVQKFNDLIWTH